MKVAAILLILGGLSALGYFNYRFSLRTARKLQKLYGKEQTSDC
jgi:hypothetical protein